MSSAAMNRDERPVAFSQVFNTELDAIAQRRRACLANVTALGMMAEEKQPLVAWTGRSPELVQAVRKTEQRALEDDLFGVALSGGGIRSATFALGVLQALAKYGFIPHIDYLSTVSGGGYIGSWLAAWIKREGANDRLEEPAQAVRAVQSQLNPSRQVEASGRLDHSDVVFDEDPEPIHHLRSYSNYLVPRLGFFSADSWVLGAIYLRNLLLNQAALVPMILTLLLLVRIVVLFYEWQPDRNWETGLTVVSFLAFAVAGGFIGRSLWRLAKTREGELGRRSINRELWLLHGLILSPLLLFSILLTWLTACVGAEPLNWQLVEKIDQTVQLRNVLREFRGRWDQTQWIDALLIGVPVGLFNAVKYFVLWVGSLSLKRQQPKRSIGRNLWGVFCGFAAGTLFGCLAYLILVRGFHKLYFSDHNEHLVATVGPPLVLFLFVLTSFVEVGLQRENMDEGTREWWSSLAGWIGVYGTVWLCVFGLALGGPPAFQWLGSWSHTAQGATVLGWIGMTAGGVLSGKSPLTSGKTSNPLESFAYAGAAAFLAGLIVLLAIGLNAEFGSIPAASSDTATLHTSLCIYLLASGACFLAALLVGQRVGVNTFSLQHMYANRLIRCYLGASRQKDPAEIDRPTGPNCNSPPPLRRPNPITGFDPLDNMPLSSLTPSSDYFGPLLIVNTALNMNSGDELAWQERKAESFVLTPQYSGSETTGYRPTTGFATNLSLGDAVAISGAAISPNMGYHTSPAISALLTVFNVRLGAWLGNPAGKFWEWNEPWSGLLHLLKELCGRTDSRSDFVYLSDGGHFENLGIYELVRRRCQFILASDADEDGQFHFADLGALVRKCRTDLGVGVEIRIGPIQDGSSWWALGTIRYSDVNPNASDGLLLYVKPVVTTDAPVDVESYRKANSTFPHQTTLDQFFTESQFESYRILGQDCVDRQLAGAVDRIRRAGNDINGLGFVKAVFQQLVADRSASTVQTT